MENPNAAWNDFSTRIIQRDVSFQVSSNFLSDEEQTKSQMATLGQELQNPRSELQEHRVNAVQGNPRTVDPNQKGRQNATRFCNYCRTNGHTPSWCLKRMRDEEQTNRERELPRKKSRLLRTTTKNEDQTMDQNTGLGAKISKGGTRITLTMDSGENPPLPIRFSPRPNFAYGNNHPNNGRSYDQSPNQSFNRSDGNDLEMEISTIIRELAK